MWNRFVLLAFVFTLTLLGFVPTARAADPDLSGKWSGKFVNSLGYDGEDSLEIVVTKEGNVTGTWDGKKIEKGERVRDDLLQWEAELGKKRYRALCHVKGNGAGLLVEYTVTSLRDNPKRVFGYTGTSLLFKKP